MNQNKLKVYFLQNLEFEMKFFSLYSGLNLFLMVMYCLSLRKFCSSWSRHTLVGLICDLTGLLVYTSPICFSVLCLLIMEYIWCLWGICSASLQYVNLCLNVWECLTTKTMDGKAGKAGMHCFAGLILWIPCIKCVVYRGVVMFPVCKIKRHAVKAWALRRGSFKQISVGGRIVFDHHPWQGKNVFPH